MKIVSKDSIETNKVKKSGYVSPKSAGVKPKPVLSNKKVQLKTEPIVVHYNVKRKQTRSTQNEKKSVPIKKEAKKEVKKDYEPTFFSNSYDRFVSLLRFNITFKLTLGYAIRLLVLITFLFALVYISFSYYLFTSTQNKLIDQTQYVQNMIVDSQDYKSEQLNQYVSHVELTYYAYNTDFTQVYSTSTTPVDYNNFSLAVEYDFRTFPNFPDLHQSGLVVLSDGTTIHYVLVANMTSYSNIIESTFPIGFVLCFVLIISSIRSSSKMANKHLKPIRTMTVEVKDMSANNLSTRLNVSGIKDELKDLALTFNQMLDDIQKSYEREKQFVSDASHELRTPIAVIKGYAGMLNRWGKDDPAILDESISAILGETDNMHSLVESLLFIARNDKGVLKMDMINFSFSELFTEIVKETRLIDSQHEISESIENDLIVHGSADKLKQSLRIFIDNSIKYTPNKGKISITLRSSANSIIIIISDDGIGISKEDLPHIFDRFYRADKSRTKMKENQHGGTGLGLSIAKIIIEQHTGNIHVDSTLNEGTTFTLLLPKLTVD